MQDSDVLNSDVILTGVMEPKTFTITIKSNNSNNQTRTYSAKYGERFTLPSCPFSAVTNYTFNNYTYNGTTYSVGEGVTVTGDMTITCNWTYHAPPPANEFRVSLKIEHRSDPNYPPCRVAYFVENVIGSYKNKEIGVRFYWGSRGYKSSLTAEEPSKIWLYFGGLVPAGMGEINKVELRDGFDGSVLLTKNITLIKNGSTDVTLTLS